MTEYKIKTARDEETVKNLVEAAVGVRPTSVTLALVVDVQKIAFAEELTVEQKAKLYNLLGRIGRKQDWKAVVHWAEIADFNISAEKPLVVKRTVGSVTHQINCFATQSLVDAYQSGKLNIGDYVIVVYVDEDPDKPLAVAKIYR